METHGLFEQFPQAPPNRQILIVRNNPSSHFMKSVSETHYMYKEKTGNHFSAGAQTYIVVKEESLNLLNQS